ncbi:lipocalin-like domain-containing protein [Bifidobacterium vansinderenii]|nr:lipocalin-like domain-containing protein [Bifidobacterium vansinderenii]
MMNNTNNSLTHNIRTFHHGTEPLVDPIQDTFIRTDKVGNSWFWVGHFETGGHTLNFMYHVSVLQFSKYLPVRMINSVLSITDETGRIYRHEDRFYKVRRGQVAGQGLHIHTDKDVIEGDLDNMRIASAMPDGSIYLDLHGTGYPLYSLGTGYFQIAGVANYQYSFPHMAAKGVITLDGQRHEVEGMVWMDRQFAGMPKGRSLKDGYNCKWLWMNLCFDNDPDVISLWGVTELATGSEHCWASVLHEDGTQSSAGVDPMVGDSFNVWESPVTGMKYPTGWTISIPEWEAKLIVTSIMDEQEIASPNPSGRKYEGASQVVGTYRGHSVTGHCCLELVGGWN